MQSSTGHKVAKGKRLSKKGREALKRTLYLGQIAVSTVHDFCNKNAKASVWKNVSHSVLIYYSMIKHNKHYMPLRDDISGRNSSIKRQFSKIKEQAKVEPNNKVIQVFKAGVCSMFKTLSKLIEIRELNQKDCPQDCNNDFEPDWSIMPSYINNYRLPTIDNKYRRSLIRGRLKMSLLTDFREFFATIDTFSQLKDGFMSIFGNDYFKFLDMCVNDIACRNYVYTKTVKSQDAKDIINIVNKKINELGKKSKNTLSTIKKADKYARATSMTLEQKEILC